MENTQNTTDASLQFSQSFTIWFKTEFPGQKWLKDEYVSRDVTTGAYRLNVDLDAAYRSYFPDLSYSGVLEQFEPSFYDTGMLIELAYGELIRPESRDAFAQLVNLRLREFNAPLRFLQGGFVSMSNNPTLSTTKLTNNITTVHKAAAALFIVLILVSVLRGC